MKSLKKNQIIIYTFALMLVTAGYLNYTNKIGKETTETASQETYVSELETADIGDAKLVNSNDVVTENNTQENNTNENKSNDNTQENSNAVNQNTSVENDATKDKEKENLLQASSTTNSNSNDYFVKSKLERDAMYSQMIETYENILNSSNSLETRKTICNTRNYKNK